MRSASLGAGEQRIAPGEVGEGGERGVLVELFEDEFLRAGAEQTEAIPAEAEDQAGSNVLLGVHGAASNAAGDGEHAARVGEEKMRAGVRVVPRSEERRVGKECRSRW